MTAPIQLARPTETQSHRPITSHHRSQHFKYNALAGPARRGGEEEKKEKKNKTTLHLCS